LLDGADRAVPPWSHRNPNRAVPEALVPGDEDAINKLMSLVCEPAKRCCIEKMIENHISIQAAGSTAANL
jgi:hypothetical protein